MLGGFLLGEIVTALIIIFCVMLLSLFWLVGASKRLKQLRSDALHAFSKIENLLRRRHDLIPELARKIDLHADDEHEALNIVIAARNQAAAAHRRINGDPGRTEMMHKIGIEERRLTRALSHLLAEHHIPAEWKDDPQWQEICYEVSELDHRIDVAWLAYNDSIRAYNTAIGQLPRRLIASRCGCHLLALL